MNMIRFDLSIYRENAVLSAIQDYRSIADIRCQKTKKEMLCEIVHSEYDPALTEKEFCNYVIALTVSMEGAS